MINPISFEVIEKSLIPYIIPEELQVIVRCFANVTDFGWCPYMFMQMCRSFYAQLTSELSCHHVLHLIIGGICCLLGLTFQRQFPCSSNLQQLSDACACDDQQLEVDRGE